MKIRHPIIYMLLLFEIAVISLLFMFNLNEDIRQIVAAVAIIQLSVNLGVIRKAMIPLFSLPGLFLIFSFVFHFGEVLLGAWGLDKYLVWNVLEKTASYSIFNQSCIFALFVQALLTIGVLWGNGSKFRFQSKGIFEKQIYKNDTLKKVYRTGVVLFFITVIPTVIYDLEKIIIVLKGGNYLETYRVGESLGVLYLLTLLFPMACIMVLIGLKNNKFSATLFLGIVCAYEVFCMLSGNRCQQIILIICLMYIYSKLIHQFKSKEVIIGGVVGYFVLAFFSMLSNYRNFNLFKQSNLKELFIGILQNSPIVQALGEFGGTLLTVTLAFFHYPTNVPYKLGSTYIFGWTAIFPNLWSKFTTEYSYTYTFPNTSYALGGSYIGELYVNFGFILGVVFACAIGFFIGKVNKSIDRSLKDQNWFALTVYMVLFNNLIFWVRDYFYHFIFVFIWGIVVITLIIRFFYKDYGVITYRHQKEGK